MVMMPATQAVHRPAAPDRGTMTASRFRVWLPITAVIATLFVVPSGEAQPGDRVPRLCFLTFDPGTAQSPSSRFDGFFQGLRDLGYVHGRTLTVDYMTANGRGELFPALAAECVRLNADIIAVTTTPAAQAAKTATRTEGRRAVRAPPP